MKKMQNRGHMPERDVPDKSTQAKERSPLIAIRKVALSGHKKSGFQHVKAGFQGRFGEMPCSTEQHYT